MRTTTPEPPDYLTVEEAARILRIGRTAAYSLARKWRETDGREGLPVTEFGRLLRVPRAALERLTGGLVTAMPAVVNEMPSVASGSPIAEAPHPSPHATNQRHRRCVSLTSSDQPTLPLTLTRHAPAHRTRPTSQAQTVASAMRELLPESCRESLAC